MRRLEKEEGQRRTDGKREKEQEIYRQPTMVTMTFGAMKSGSWFYVLQQEDPKVDLVDVEVSEMEVRDKTRAIPELEQCLNFMGSTHTTSESSGVHKTPIPKPKKKVQVYIPVSHGNFAENGLSGLKKSAQ